MDISKLIDPVSTDSGPPNYARPPPDEHRPPPPLWTVNHRLEIGSLDGLSDSRLSHESTSLPPFNATSLPSPAPTVASGSLSATSVSPREAPSLPPLRLELPPLLSLPSPVSPNPFPSTPYAMPPSFCPHNDCYDCGLRLGYQHHWLGLKNTGNLSPAVDGHVQGARTSPWPSEGWNNQSGYYHGHYHHAPIAPVQQTLRQLQPSPPISSSAERHQRQFPIQPAQLTRAAHQPPARRKSIPSSSDDNNTITAEGDRNYPCLRCKASFRTSSQLSRHNNTVHSMHRNHACRVNGGCGAVFKRSDNRAVHERTCDGTGEGRRGRRAMFADGQRR